MQRKVFLPILAFLCSVCILEFIYLEKYDPGNYSKIQPTPRAKDFSSWETCKNRKDPDNKAFGAQSNDTYDQVFNSTRDEYDLALEERGTKPLLILFYSKALGKLDSPSYAWESLGAQGRTDKATCSSNCVYTLDNRMIRCADLVAVHNVWGGLNVTYLEWLREKNEAVPWVWIQHESPNNTHFHPLNELFQFTATYSLSSELWVPYYKVIPKEKPDTSGTAVDHAKGKSKNVIAFMSNCVEYRIKFIRQLGKHVQIDFFGKCNRNASFPRNSGKQKQYKFFLALENSFCEDYHTEKFYWQGFVKGLIPITFFDSDLLKNHPFLAPSKSFINIFDFPNMKAVADHLNYLSNNDTAYNEYHAWRNDFTVREMDQCSICEEAHRINVKEKRGLPTIKIEEIWNQTKCIGYDKELFQKYLNNKTLEK